MIIPLLIVIVMIGMKHLWNNLCRFTVCECNASLTLASPNHSIYCYNTTQLST